MFADGALPAKTKQLIAVAVAHVTQCPYCIKGHTKAALRAGASGFLLKDMSGDEIVAAVRRAAAGADNVLAPAVVGRLVERFTRSAPSAAGAGALAQLTPREVEVLERIATGRSNAEIARDLWIGETTVKTHVAAIYRKLEATNRREAIARGRQLHLI